MADHTPELLGKGRIEALSDGVFAIVVTLLVLELRVPALPEPVSNAVMATALRPVVPKVLSLVISFLTVCVIWLSHHRLFTLLAKVDVPFFWLNANLLLWVTLIPFPTALIGDHPGSAVALSVYGVAMSLMGWAFVLIRVNVRRSRCLHDDVDAVAFGKGTLQVVLLSPVAYSLGAVLAWVWPPLAFLVFVGIPVYFVFPHAVRARAVASG